MYISRFKLLKYYIMRIEIVVRKYLQFELHVNDF